MLLQSYEYYYIGQSAQFIITNREHCHFSLTIQLPFLKWMLSLFWMLYRSGVLRRYSLQTTEPLSVKSCLAQQSPPLDLPHSAGAAVWDWAACVPSKQPWLPLALVHSSQHPWIMARGKQRKRHTFQRALMHYNKAISYTSTRTQDHGIHMTGWWFVVL